MTASVTSQWRQANSSDLPDIEEIGAQIHPDLPERMEVYAEKLRLFPQGFLTLVADGRVVGYGVSHPWKLRQIPALDAFLARLPIDADCLHVHDVAVLDAFRGQGATASYVATITTLARRLGIGALALVSVYGTDTMWDRFGFRTLEPDPALRDKLRCYGATAKYMIRD